MLGRMNLEHIHTLKIRKSLRSIQESCLNESSQHSSLWVRIHLGKFQIERPIQLVYKRHIIHNDIIEDSITLEYSCLNPKHTYLIHSHNKLLKTTQDFYTVEFQS